jgi:hypothetical protein
LIIFISRHKKYRPKQLLHCLGRLYGAYTMKLRRKEGIIPMANGMELFVQQKGDPVEREAVGNSLREMLDKMRENEERMEKARQEHLEKVAKQQAERAMALGS